MTSHSKINQAATVIKNFGIVCYPTETIYGLGVLFDSEEALHKLYALKKRDSQKPISLLVSSVEMLENITEEISDTAQMLINEFWPGPLTLVFKISSKIPENIRMLLTADTNTIGVRISSCTIAQELVQTVGKPITTTSANISGEESSTDLEYIKKKLEIDYYLPAENEFLMLPSTVLDVTKTTPKIIREGAITRQSLKNYLKSILKSSFLDSL